MIQRIQSLWLFLAAIFAVITFKLPFYSGDKLVNYAANATAHSDLNASSTVWFTLLTGLSGLLALVTIFLFKNRNLQLKIAAVGLFTSLALLFMYFTSIGNFLPQRGNFALSGIFYFGMPICFILAMRGISRDNKLIKSLDRLR